MENISELIDEVLQEFGKFLPNAESSFVSKKHGIREENFQIVTDKDSKKYGKAKGKYTLINFKEILVEGEQQKYYINYLSKVIQSYLGKIGNGDTILVIGLGNRHISPDSLGVEVIKNIVITRNMVDDMPKLCAFAPSVLGLTGIESVDVVSGLIDKVKPSKVVVIDSLCASDVSRLSKSIQITDSGLTPGAGIKNVRKRISERVTNCKTVAIGVPLVVYANTFIKSAFRNANISQEDIRTNKKLNDILLSDYQEIVTLSDIQEVVEKLGVIVGRAINLAVLGIESLD